MPQAKIKSVPTNIITGFPELDQKNDKKDRIIRALIKLRVGVFKIKREWQKQMEKEAIEKCENKTAVELRSAELEQEFCSFSNCDAARGTECASEECFL